MKLEQAETCQELIEAVTTVFPNALVVVTEGEIVIQTGIGLSMGDYLEPLDDEELEEIRA
jgi:aromatic ring-opening dioxygenase LigB subunit